MIKPKFAKVLLNNKIYSIHRINYKTKQITLRESRKVFLTVLLKDVDLIYDKEN